MRFSGLFGNPENGVNVHFLFTGDAYYSEEPLSVSNSEFLEWHLPCNLRLLLSIFFLKATRGFVNLFMITQIEVRLYSQHFRL